MHKERVGQAVQTAEMILVDHGNTSDNRTGVRLRGVLGLDDPDAPSFAR